MAAILDQAWLQGKIEKSEPKILFCDRWGRVFAIRDGETLPVLPFSKSKFLVFVIKISRNSLDCIRYFLEISLKFH
jgi:hypothetical protein